MSTHASTKIPKSAVGMRAKPVINKSDLSKMQALVRSDRERHSPLREKNRNVVRETEQPHSQEHTMLSDVKSTKSVPRPAFTNSKSATGYEPMRHKRPSNDTGLPGAVEQVR